MSFDTKFYGVVTYLYFFYIYCYLLCWFCNGVHYFQPHFETFVLANLFPCSVEYPCNPNWVPESLRNVPAKACINAIMVFIWGYVHTWMVENKEKLQSFFGSKTLRTTYVLVSAVSMRIMITYWLPLFPDTMMWGNLENVEPMHFSGILFGWVFILISTFMIDHFDLFGLRQSLELYSENKNLVTRGFYSCIRHPIMTGWFMMFWFSPVMSVARFQFACLMSFYIIWAVPIEEKRLLKTIPEYAAYQQKTGAYFPCMCYGKAPPVDEIKKKE